MAVNRKSSEVKTNSEVQPDDKNRDFKKLIEKMIQKQSSETPTDLNPATYPSGLTRLLGGKVIKSLAESTYREKREQQAARIQERELLETVRSIARTLANDQQHKPLQNEESNAPGDNPHDYTVQPPGRPGSSQYVIDELVRRIEADQLEETLAEQARVLARWLCATHPKAPFMTPKSIENAIRHIYWEAKS